MLALVGCGQEMEQSHAAVQSRAFCAVKLWVILHVQAYGTLLSSESEDDAGPVASVRRWWTGKKPKRCARSAAPRKPDPNCMHLLCMIVSDTAALRLATHAVEQRDQERHPDYSYVVFAGLSTPQYCL